MSEPARTVGILIFDDVEVLDFCGPFEVFATARLPGAHSADPPLFEVLTIAEQARLVTCRGGLLVQPQATTAAHPPLDILVVPGGQGTCRERLYARLLDWIVAQSQRVELTTSVCTGAFLLAPGLNIRSTRLQQPWRGGGQTGSAAFTGLYRGRAFWESPRPDLSDVVCGDGGLTGNSPRRSRRAVSRAAQQARP